VRFKGIGALSLAMAAVGLLYAAAARDRSGQEDHDLVGKGLLQVRRRRAARSHQEVEAKTGIKVELSQYAIQDMIPKTVAALDFLARCLMSPYSSSYDVQAQGSGRSRASLRISPISWCR